MVVDQHMPPGRVIVAVGAIVQDDAGRTVVVKHRPERGGFWKDRWIFPGGKLNLGETMEEGTRREVLEETHLEIDVLRPNPVAERIVKDRDALLLHVLYVTHMARRTGGELRADSDVGEARWMDRKQLAEHWGELHEDTQKIALLAEII